MKYLFVVDEIKGGTLTVPINDGKDMVSLDIYRNMSNTDIDIIDGQIYITVNLKTTVNISEIDGSFDFTSPDGRKILKEKSDDYLEDEIKSFIEKIQKEEGIDIFSFGNKIFKKHPKIWKEIKDDWSGIFSKLNIKVISDIRIKSSQHITRPIGAELNDQ